MAKAAAPRASSQPPRRYQTRRAGRAPSASDCRAAVTAFPGSAGWWPPVHDIRIRSGPPGHPQTTSHNGPEAGASGHSPGYPYGPKGRIMRRRHRQSHHGHRRRSVIIVVTVVALVVAAAAAGGGYLLLRTKGSPQQTAASYLSGWQHGDYAAMDRASVNVPQSGLAGPLRRAAA